MSFIHEDFLLPTDAAQRLYHDFAASCPIIDYHCHLPPADLAGNRRFAQLHSIWLEGDHYKWRAMRANGEDERLCTGDAPPREKFLAWARTVPRTLRNPLYHWTHLELKRYFGIDALLGPDNAESIWNQANAQLATDELSAWGILKKFNVKVIGTTDDPTDDLAHHQTLAGSDCPARVVPTFRPDPAMKCADPVAWNAWVDRLAQRSGEACDDLAGFLGAMEVQHAVFDAAGARCSDHGLERCPTVYPTSTYAAQVFARLRSGKTVSAEEAEGFAGFILAHVGELNASRGWVMQLHLGARRNVNAALFRDLGADVGCDTIGDFPQGPGLAALLGELSGRGTLPKTILYNLNPADNYLFATMIGNYAEAGVPGKMQFGSGWWFLDQLDGMTLQMNALSSLGLLHNFVGMLTDSRSFMSYPRHEYFRRLLCKLLGDDVEAGLLPNDLDLLGKLVTDVAHANAERYFGFELAP